MLFQSLSFPATLLTSPEQVLQSGIVILPAALSKGLEFDAVIADCSDISDPNMLYLLCTRALHRLYLLCEKEIPPVLKRAQQFWHKRGI